MVLQTIKTEGVRYISIEDYKDFFYKIPDELWAQRPVFYQKDGKFDALGFLGERIHSFTLITKTFQLYFLDCLEMQITHVLDNKEPKFISIKNPKDRVIAALDYLKLNTTELQLRNAFYKAKQIMYGRYY